MKIGESVVVRLLEHGALKRAVRRGRVTSVSSHRHGTRGLYGAIAVLKARRKRKRR